MSWQIRWILKPLLFAACLLPALRLVCGAFGIGGVSLGADPVAMLLHTCGKWTLNFLMITLCMTPLRESHAFGPAGCVSGACSACSRFSTCCCTSRVYLLLDQEGKLGALWQDIVKRPYITIGMLGLLLLIPLAATSTAKAQRRLGRRWTRLHRLVYVVAVLGRLALLVAGQEGHPRALALRLRSRVAARLSPVEGGARPSHAVSVARFARTDGA